MESKKKWRLLPCREYTGAMNMAIDESILYHCGRGMSEPTLRFYTWKQPTLTLGYFQKAQEEIDFKVCADRGVEVVRRLTGGRAVLHQEELTYSILVGEDYPDLPSTIIESYKYLSAGLLEGLQRLGVGAQMERALPRVKAGEHSTAACFDAVSHYELTVAMKKLVGSAQVRKDKMVLQHGSVLLDFVPENLVSLLLTKKTVRGNKLVNDLANKVATLQEVLGYKPTLLQVETALIAGMEQALQLELQVGELTAAELAMAQELARDKYASPEWTYRR